MIYYKILRRVNFNNITVYYLCTTDFKYKKPSRVFDPADLNMYVYKDFDSLLPTSKLDLLNEDLFDVLTYKEVEDLFGYIQNYIYTFRYLKEAKKLLDDLENILLFWDDYH